MSISCSIVCYQNAPEQITRVLRSLAGSSTANSCRIFVTIIDNSLQNELSEVARAFGAEYIHLPNNPGFGAAHNVAINRALIAGATYHLVLNPDIHFSGNVIPTLLDFMDKHFEVGLVMPGIRYPDGRDQHLCKLLPRPADLFMRRFFPTVYESSGRLARYEMHASGYDKIMEAPALSGCFMLIRTSVLREIGIFDERFFMYLEDVDLSRRIGRVAKTIYFPHVSITHEYVKGSYKNKKLLFHHIRSAVLYFNKWGWIWDKERDRVNRKALQNLELLKTEVGSTWASR